MQLDLIMPIAPEQMLVKFHFDVEARQKGNFIQTRYRKGYKWHTLCRRDAITLGLPSNTSVSIHYPAGHIYTRFHPALNHLVMDEIEAMYPAEMHR